MNSVDKNIEIIYKTLQILCIFGFESKMLEVQQQRNRCYKCYGHKIKYPRNVPHASLISFGDNSIGFNCTGTIFWIAACNDCGIDMPISVHYDYNVKSGIVVITCQDSFLGDENAYGHCKSSKWRLGTAQ